MGNIRLAKHDPPGRIVSTRSGRFHVYEVGAGETPVILEAGIAATSLSWVLVQKEAGKFARVIAYDRAGLGWSDPPSTPRTPSNIARELREWLDAAEIRPPFLLVGHSFGGLVIERFAIDNPQLIYGLILVDALSPAEFCPLTDYHRGRLQRAVQLSRRGAFLARIGVVGACLSLVLGGNQVLPKLAARVSSGSGGQGLTSRLAGEIRKLPRDVWPMIASHWAMPKSFESMAAHLDGLPESCREMSGAHLPEVPVTVISAATNQHGAGVGLPRDARLITAERSGHWVQLDEPDVVVDEIRTMLRRGSESRESARRDGGDAG